MVLFKECQNTEDQDQGRDGINVMKGQTESEPQKH